MMDKENNDILSIESPSGYNLFKLAPIKQNLNEKDLQNVSQDVSKLPDYNFSKSIKNRPGRQTKMSDQIKHLQKKFSGTSFTSKKLQNSLETYVKYCDGSSSSHDNETITNQSTNSEILKLATKCLKP